MTVAPLTPLRWLTAWTWDVPVLLVVLALAALYLLGVRRASTVGRRWPVRTTCWFLIAGLGSLVLSTMSFFGVYQRVLFWPLAAQDVLLLTIVPVGLTLGRPIALWRAGRAVVAPGSRQGGIAEPTVRAAPAGRRALQRLVRLLSFPLVGSVLAVATLLLLYTTHWDVARLEHPWLAQLTRLALLAAGCSFLWPLLGVDERTGRTSYPVRAFIAFLDGLLDAIPGLAVLGTNHLIAGSFYAQVGRTWGPSLAKDQQLGGTAMVAVSELVGLPTMLVLLLAWVREDARQARAVDVELDGQAAAGSALVGADRAPSSGREHDGEPVGSPDSPGAAATRQEPPVLLRPWWEVDAGPLADRAQRYGWTTPTDPRPDGPATGGAEPPLG